LRDFLIDTDTASDDAVALIMAFRASDVRVIAVTTVAGNVGVEQATRNALHTAELCAVDVPIHIGAATPLVRPLESATWFHGGDGLGDHGYPPPLKTADEEPAVDAILRLSHKHEGLTLVTLGPLTNIAHGLQRDPSLAKRISRAIVMGGAPCCEGNVTPAAEYNIWVDPEAAQIVLRSGMPIELIGWHLCRHDAALNPSEIEEVLSLKTPAAQFAIECNSHAREAYRVQTGEDGISLPDPVCMAIAIDRSTGTTWSRHKVEVETASALTRGITVVDRLNVSNDNRNRVAWRDAGEVDVCWTIEVARWKSQLRRALDSA
jgi:purine nucleosidase